MSCCLLSHIVLVYGRSPTCRISSRSLEARNRRPTATWRSRPSCPQPGKPASSLRCRTQSRLARCIARGSPSSSKQPRLLWAPHIVPSAHAATARCAQLAGGLAVEARAKHRLATMALAEAMHTCLNLRRPISNASKNVVLSAGPALSTAIRPRGAKKARSKPEAPLLNRRLGVGTLLFIYNLRGPGASADLPKQGFRSPAESRPAARWQLHFACPPCNPACC